MERATVKWYSTFFARNARAWLTWHAVSPRRCQIPHSTRINGLMDLLVNIYFRRYNAFRLFLWRYVKAHIYTDNSIDARRQHWSIYSWVTGWNIEKSMPKLDGPFDELWTIDPNKDFINFSEFYMFFFFLTFPIAFKKSPDKIKPSLTLR